MYLKAIRLKGFKSFARQTSLVFEPGVGVIVGPNGSGKSNLADAVVWALGEQSPTSLRSGSMQDVIFAGSDGRRPLASAEVELTFDNTDKALPLPAEEVSVMRRVTRDGASQYSINHSSCRLTDVIELLAPLGLGKELHSIIGQGKVEAFLAGKPEDRRAQIEEAAGLGAFKRRRERAELKMREVRRNLERVALLEREVDTQLAPLRRQATAAEQLAALQSDMGETRGRLLTGAIAELDHELAERSVELAVLESRRAEGEAGLASVAEARGKEEEAFARRLAERERRAQRLLRARLMDTRLETCRRLTEQRLRLAQEMQSAAEAERNRLIQELAGAEDVPEDDGWPATELRLQTELENAREACAEATGRLEGARELLSARRSALARIAVEREGALATAARLERRQEALAEEEHHLRAQHRRLAEETAEAETAEGAAKERQAGVAADLTEATVAAEAAAREAALAAGTVAEIETRHQATLFAARAAQAEIEHLTAALTDLQDVGHEVLDVARAYEGAVPVSDALSCAPGYERALAAALSQTAGALAIPPVIDHWSLLHALRRAGVGLARLVVARGDQRRVPVFPGSVPLLTKVDTGGRPELERTLAEVVLVDDLRAVPDEFPGLAVTRDGGFYRPSAGQIGLAGGLPAALLLERRAALVRLRRELEDLDRDAAKDAASLETARQRSQEAAEASAAANAAAGLARTALEAVERALATMQSRRRDLGTALARIQPAVEAISGEQAEIRAAAETAAVEAADALFRAEALHPECERAEAQVAESEHVHAEAQALVTRRRVELEERRAAAQREAARRHAARQHAAAGRARLKELDERLLELPGVQGLCAALLSRVTAVHTHLTRVVAALEPAPGGDADMNRDGLRALAEHEAALRRDLDDAAERRVGVQVALTRLEERRREVAAELEKVSEETERAGFAAPADEAEEQSLRDRFERLVRRRERLGPVNPLAAEECAELDERAGFLREQRRDLERSLRDLEQLIQDLTARVDAEFAETFAAVREHFVHMVAVLFPGGRGSLELMAPEEEGQPGGVSVQVKPAKKLGQRLQLLSGGERSLVAIAFLMALVLARPSPLYILDEIEAALDDVNIGRLVKLLRDYRSRTQFIVITHQKRTMDAADVLYGVTMGPDGASQVVSARMAEAAIDREARSREPSGTAE